MAVPLTLKVFKGDTLVASKDYERDIIKIGRLSSAHLCLEDEKVSRIHSVIEVASDGSMSIIDMGSVEGTYVNNKRVNKGQLTFGDEIRVGGTTIRLENPAAVAAVNLAAAASTDETTEKNPVVSAAAPASGLAQAAAVAAPAVAGALDASVAATQKNATVAPEPEPAAPEAPAPQVAEAAAPRPRTVRRSKSSGPQGVALRFSWGDQRVGEFFVGPGSKRVVAVGSAAGVDFVMGDDKLGAPRFEVLRTDGQSFVVRFMGKMKGGLIRKGETLDLKAVLEAGKASHEGDAYSLTLEAEDFFWVDLGGVTLEASFQAVPKRVVAPLGETLDYTALNIFLLVFFAATAFVITALNRTGEGDEYSDELSSNSARIAKLIIKPPEVQKNKFLERLNQQKEAKKSGEMAAKSRGDEGQMGKKDAPKTNNRTAPKGDPNKKDEARALTAKIFGGGKGGISTVFGSKGLGGDLKSAMGNMFGAKAGDSGGFGGLGLRGGGGGGGGTGDTVGIGGIGTKGRGGGTGTYGTGVGVLGGKSSVDVNIASSEVEVMGSLDKELIRKVIQANRGQIRYCYESLLNRFPKLGGKVAVKFVITATGSVASSSVAQSTAGNAELETCVASRVRTWKFPEPKGGGVVVVTYPFIFTRSGE
ncbi:FHA domain/TonB domain-containing protein [Myxococcus stipitatus DSM 14675]|uniref:FHA domain/TonB domain-containing protein n=1 Tax=Myxococcus stipitatus (strain DSM 14675 / JCM 12634 / Mx s8) TaxID=1278073 RepID=L7UJK5_MYXSD|nr:adventurous gliding motility protein GltG [Myxococcus stipitatus]AGC46629.1 FHA domain/TonB domain-containing protein [Myxococcus stipitatus DSM 14675]